MILFIAKPQRQKAWGDLSFEKISFPTFVLADSLTSVHETLRSGINGASYTFTRIGT